MNLIYQWFAWAYSNIACLKVKEILDIRIENIIPKIDFFSVWENIDDNNFWVLPIENSYAWSIHENLYNFLRYDFKIIWEVNLQIDHCLLSNETSINNIKEVYSHPQALSQTHNFLKNHKIKGVSFWDTAWAAKMISTKKKMWIAAVASYLAWKIYNLNIISEKIQDQDWNTTRFLIVAPKNTNIKNKYKKNKTSIIFETKNLPSALYKCLWVFATNNINLTKIESMPSLKNPFTYMFWLDLEWTKDNISVSKALDELKDFTNIIRILGEY